jgi:hypothetical protein
MYRFLLTWAIFQLHSKWQCLTSNILSQTIAWARISSHSDSQIVATWAHDYDYCCLYQRRAETITLDGVHKEHSIKVPENWRTSRSRCCFLAAERAPASCAMQGGPLYAVCAARLIKLSKVQFASLCFLMILWRQVCAPSCGRRVNSSRAPTSETECVALCPPARPPSGMTVVTKFADASRFLPVSLTVHLFTTERVWI